jgi:hypothetical protein
MRISILLLVWNFFIEGRHVTAGKLRHEQQQKYLLGSVQAERANKSTSIFSSTRLWEDEFGRLSDEIHENGRQQNQRITASLRTVSSSTLSSNNNTLLKLRTTSQQVTSSSPRNLLAQTWHSVATSFQESTHQTDGVILSRDDAHPTGSNRRSRIGINQHVRVQEREAIFAAEEMQELFVMSMLMSMPSDVR